MIESGLNTVLQNERNYGLDFLKIVATILIVFHHYQQTTTTIFEDGINYFFGSFYFGRMVELFFIISGYLMDRYVPVISQGLISLKEWCFVRARRLLPMVAVSVFIEQILLYVHNLNCSGKVCAFYLNRTVNLFGTLITALGLQYGGAFNNPEINNPTWYISVLLMLYVVFYITISFAKKLNCSPNYLFLFWVFIGCGVHTYGINLPYLNEGTYRGYYCFFYGVLLAEYVRKHGVSKRLSMMSICTLLAFLYLFLNQRKMVESDMEYLLSFVVFPALIILTETKILRRLFSKPFWGIWGQTSFNVYIWHGPLFIAMFIVTDYLNRNPNFGQRKWMYMFAFLTQIVGVISFYCIEKPINRYISQKWKI